MVKIPNHTQESGSNVIIVADKEIGVGSVQGIETLILDKVNLTAILESLKGRGLCSVLLDLRGGFNDFEDILKGVEGNLVQKLVVEVLPVWSETKQDATAIKSISQRAGLKNFEPKKEGKSVLLEGYL